ncbi:MAG: DUF58 domain-containing protein [Verrucomicrobiales bacterium]|nr:DUF58 domain-containing protein [Verrucomicrobiales bacterium]MBI61747.1 DUF58 domain-containing protein [Verrucomicrobiales bacterium]|tara:strand:+ start:1704 stop:2603 length:900 start_codon:yes stop_codon:yes gene_type:complete
MASINDILQPEELQSIVNLQLMAKQTVEGAITGQHRSPHKGFSVEFAQHREYVQGDEIRRVDWKVFAKTDRYYVREYEEETNLRAMLLLDASGSMGYKGENGITKLQHAIKLSACLAHIIMKQSDSIGLMTFDTKIRSHIPPRSSTRHLRILYEEMLKTRPGGETDVSKVFHDIVPRIDKRGMVFILSDCFTDVKSLLASVAHFRHASHEVVIFHVMDRDEVEFPFDAWTRFENLERTAEFQMVDPASFRAAYLDNFAKFTEALKLGCQRHRVELVPMYTHEPLTDSLARFLRMRQGVV